jgi:hypothetical protein
MAEQHPVLKEIVGKLAQARSARVVRRGGRGEKVRHVSMLHNEITGGRKGNNRHVDVRQRRTQTVANYN